MARERGGPLSDGLGHVPSRPRATGAGAGPGSGHARSGRQEGPLVGADGPLGATTGAAGAELPINSLNEEIFGLIYRQMYSLTGGRRQDLDDLVQDAAEQALRSLPSFRGASKLSTWTYQIAYRTVLRNRRWYGRWLRRFALSLSGELPEAPFEVDHGADGVGDGGLEERERIERLRAAVQSLSPKRRAVVVLHDFEGVEVPEVAEIVGAKLTTVRSRLRDGRRDLAKQLHEDPYFSDDPGDSGVPAEGERAQAEHDGSHGWNQEMAE